jgi:hypothetical protein
LDGGGPMSGFWQTVWSSGWVALFSVKVTRWFDARQRDRRDREAFEATTATTLNAFKGDPEMRERIWRMATATRAQRGWTEG